MGWAVLCNWYYLCHIKNVCNGETQSEAGMLQAAAPALVPVEPSLIEMEVVPAPGGVRSRVVPVGARRFKIVIPSPEYLETPTRERR